jgi:hypothetical protein
MYIKKAYKGVACLKYHGFRSVYLLGGLEHELFPYIYIYIGNVIIPTDELINI